MQIDRMKTEHIEECVDLFIDVFSGEPWNEIYSSREQVDAFFQNHMSNNYFEGFVLKDQGKIIAMSIGMKKPWLEGTEYYIDQFCVKTDFQRQGAGSLFLKLIGEEIGKQGMNAIILNTERKFPSERFYLKNGFEAFDELVILSKLV